MEFKNDLEFIALYFFKENLNYDNEPVIITEIDIEKDSLNDLRFIVPAGFSRFLKECKKNGEDPKKLAEFIYEKEFDNFDIDTLEENNEIIVDTIYNPFSQKEELIAIYTKYVNYFNKLEEIPTFIGKKKTESILNQFNDIFIVKLRDLKLSKKDKEIIDAFYDGLEIDLIFDGQDLYEEDLFYDNDELANKKEEIAEVLLQLAVDTVYYETGVELGILKISYEVIERSELEKTALELELEQIESEMVN